MIICIIEVNVAMSILISISIFSKKAHCIVIYSIKHKTHLAVNTFSVKLFLLLYTFQFIFSLCLVIRISICASLPSTISHLLNKNRCQLKLLKVDRVKVKPQLSHRRHPMKSSHPGVFLSQATREPVTLAQTHGSLAGPRSHQHLIAHTRGM